MRWVLRLASADPSFGARIRRPRGAALRRRFASRVDNTPEPANRACHSVISHLLRAHGLRPCADNRRGGDRRPRATSVRSGRRADGSRDATARAGARRHAGTPVSFVWARATSWRCSTASTARDSGTARPWPSSSAGSPRNELGHQLQADVGSARDRRKSLWGDPASAPNRHSCGIRPHGAVGGPPRWGLSAPKEKLIWRMSTTRYHAEREPLWRP